MFFHSLSFLPLFAAVFSSFPLTLFPQRQTAASCKPSSHGRPSWMVCGSKSSPSRRSATASTREACRFCLAPRDTKLMRSFGRFAFLFLLLRLCYLLLAACVVVLSPWLLVRLFCCTSVACSKHANTNTGFQDPRDPPHRRRRDCCRPWSCSSNPRA